MTPLQIALAAKELYHAEAQRRPLPPLVQTYPELTLSDAYQIQTTVVEIKSGAGAQIVGKKTGLTSKAMQAMFGVSEPDFGHLLDTMMVGDSQNISVSSLMQPKVEPEIAFILNKDLKGPGIGLDDVLKATESVVASLEVIDSRIADWKIQLLDTVADNASSGRVVLGKKRLAPRNADLRLMGMVFEKNGEIVATGAGAAVMGHPGCAVAWLANKLAEYGFSLKANEIILPGSLCGAISVSPGDFITATFDHLGPVSVKFI